MKVAIRITVGLLVCGLLAGLTEAGCANGTQSADDTGGGGTTGSATGTGTGKTGSGTGTGAGTGGLGVPATTGSTGTGFGCKTTVSGTVYDPAGTLPLYDVVVYVPSTPLTPIAEGAACESCDAYYSGTPIAAALSDAAGKFSLDVTKVPIAKDIPVVIQIGKWQRQITIPSVTACADTPIDASLTHLPKNKTEGNIPQMAMVRGGSDALECLIRKLGVDDSEFTTDSGTGRVHLYYIDGGTATSGTGQLGSTALTPSTTLYADITKMMGYDIILMACPGSNSTISKSDLSNFLNVRQYADQGGRVFGSHYNGDYINSTFTPMNPYPVVVDYTASPFDFPDDFVATGIINTSFPKGKAMGDWMVNVGGSPVPGQVAIKGGIRSVDSVVNPSAESWITATDSNGMAGAVEYFAFPTPIAAPTACGRMVMSDLHVSAASGDSGKDAFPTGCTSVDLSPQEKALAFMFFDLASCVQPETSNPMPPPLK